MTDDHRRFCGNCGAALAPGPQTFCSMCGDDLRATNQRPTAPLAVPAPPLQPSRPPVLMWVGIAAAAVGAAAVLVTSLLVPGGGTVGLDELAFSGTGTCEIGYSLELSWTPTGWNYTETDSYGEENWWGALSRGGESGGWVQITGEDFGEIRAEGLSALRIAVGTPLNVTYSGPNDDNLRASMSLSPDLALSASGTTGSDECSLSAQAAGSSTPVGGSG